MILCEKNNISKKVGFYFHKLVAQVKELSNLHAALLLRGIVYTM